MMSSSSQCVEIVTDLSENGDDDRETVPFLEAVPDQAPKTPAPGPRPLAGIIADGKRHRSFPWPDHRTRQHLEQRSGDIWDRYDVHIPKRTRYRNPSSFATAGLKGLVVVLVGLTAFCSAFTWGYR